MYMAHDNKVGAESDCNSHHSRMCEWRTSGMGGHFIVSGAYD